MTARAASVGLSLAGRSTQRSFAWQPVFVGMLLVAGAALRVFAAERGLWLDETISVMHTQGSLSNVLEAQASGFHPPLYHLLLYGWSSVVGSSELALRIPSIAWSLVAVVAIWAWSREAFPQLNPLPAAALAALSPFVVWYGSEARMYAQLLALTAVCGVLVWRILAGRGGRWTAVALVASLAALLYTHYFGFLFVVALAAVACGRLFRQRADAHAIGGRTVVATCVMAAAALVPWLAWTVSRQAERGDPPVYPPPDIYSALTSGAEMFIGFHSSSAMGVITACWPVLCLLALALVPRISGLGWTTMSLLILVIVPPALLVAASYIGPHSVFDPRYLTVCVAPLYLLAGRLWGLIPAGVARTSLAIGLAIAAVGGSVWQVSDPGNPRLFEVGSAMADVNERSARGDALVVAPEFQARPVLAYYRPSSDLKTVFTKLPSEAWREVRRSRPRRIFLITSFEDPATSSRYSTDRFPIYFSKRSRFVTKSEYVNVAVREYDPHWRNQ